MNNKEIISKVWKELGIIPNQRINLIFVRKILQVRDKEELSFLKSKEIKYLIKEADIGSCHEDFKPITQRIKQLELSLETYKRQMIFRELKTKTGGNK